MDEASQLVSELHRKLHELDHKVWRYRQDMTAEFTKYAEHLLRDVPHDVSESVNQAMADSLHEYTSLHPHASASPTGPSLTSNGTDSPPTQGTSLPPRRRDEGGDRSPKLHEREKELQGLFTPSYLPLLDSTTRNERRSSMEPLSPSCDVHGKERESHRFLVDASVDTRSLQPSPDLHRPVTPKRRNTDEVSVTSDTSDGHVRRSALRRSSSVSKASPRRVRFEVEGEEVLPTVSPMPADSLISSGPLRSPGLSDDSDEDDEDEEEEEEEVEQIEDVENPPPRRISSSQALRALSRGPFVEDGTKWTTVYSPPDGSGSVAKTNGSSQNLENVHLVQEELQLASNIEDLTPTDNRMYRPPNIATSASDPDGDMSSDDDMLDMPIRQAKSPKSVSDSISALNGWQSDLPSSPTKPSLNLEIADKQAGITENPKFLEDDYQELFQFDENSDPRRPTEPLPEDSDPPSPESPMRKSPVILSPYSQSPGRSIPNPAPAPVTKPHISAPSKGIVGSYKGRPFSMPIVSDEIHAQAASLGALNSFVGSVNGRSGVDESDMASFRASGGIGSFSGTPKSMSERMMMDDLLEAEEAKRDGAQ
ncbi:hypothetical protein B7494_g4975 [Chlorociboria aeruginascens]|nr:hypothetical protein B7494_g4975 [Chlorociboria aeruginascens]